MEPDKLLPSGAPGSLWQTTTALAEMRCGRGNAIMCDSARSVSASMLCATRPHCHSSFAAQLRGASAAKSCASQANGQGQEVAGVEVGVGSETRSKLKSGPRPKSGPSSRQDQGQDW